MTEADRVRLQHMLDATRDAIAFAQGRTRSHLESDKMLMLALTRLLEILGEAAKGVSAPTTGANPHVPWRQIAGTRDRIIHRYFEVDPDIIWDIVIHDLPPLLGQLEQILTARD